MAGERERELPSFVLTLAIETSNPTAHEGAASVAISDSPLEPEFLRPATPHHDDLMGAIDRVFRRVERSPKELTEIVVSIGPGGYTSLRIAVATAKMLAEITGAKVMPLPTFKAIAWTLSPATAPAIVCLASKNDKTYGVLLPPPRENPPWPDHWLNVAEIVGLEAEMKLRDEAMHGSGGWITGALVLGLIGAEQVRAMRPKTLIADAFLPQSMKDAAAEVGATIIPPRFSASTVLRLRTEAIDPLALAPNYAREAEAVTKWRERHGG
jgi:tRNA threonylcarbamoyl adenosine modification protein YeaZ